MEAAAEGPEMPRGSAGTGAAAGAAAGAVAGTVASNQNTVVERASGEAEKILGTLRKRNQKKGRAMGRSMGALDEILHGKLKLLHVPRSA